MIIGIDPGNTGAITALDLDGKIVTIIDFPLDARNLVAALRHCLIAREPGDDVLEAVVEHQHAFPGGTREVTRPDGTTKEVRIGQGNLGSFAQGMNYGQIIGALTALGIPITTVPATTWKNQWGVTLNADERGKPNSKTVAKEKSLERARATWPDTSWFRRARDHGRAESALIAEWKRRLTAPTTEELLRPPQPPRARRKAK